MSIIPLTSLASSANVRYKLKRLVLAIAFLSLWSYASGPTIVDLTSWSREAIAPQGPVTLSRVLDATAPGTYRVPLALKLLNVKRLPTVRNQAAITLQLTNTSTADFRLPVSLDQRTVASQPPEFRVFRFGIRLTSSKYSAEELIAETAASDHDDASAITIGPGKSVVVRAILSAPDAPKNTKLHLTAICRESVASYQGPVEGTNLKASSGAVQSANVISISF